MNKGLVNIDFISILIFQVLQFDSIVLLFLHILLHCN
nr:MAG TPA: hypothetical protein [Bacteriophage sp.]